MLRSVDFTIEQLNPAKFSSIVSYQYNSINSRNPTTGKRIQQLEACSINYTEILAKVN